MGRHHEAQHRGGRHRAASTTGLKPAKVVGTGAIALAAFGMPLATAAPAFADQPGATGQNDTSTSPNDVKTPGKPDSAVGTISQFAHFLNDNGSNLGKHSSSFAPGQSLTKPENGGATGRLGVGNAARTDGMPGDSANSHFAGQIAKYDPNLVTQPPGNNDNPNRNGNPNAPSG